MRPFSISLLIRRAGFLPVLMLCTAPPVSRAQTTNVPAWAQPGSATHVQVAPPADFHRPSTNFGIPLGRFAGQSDIGSAVVPGSASYDPGRKQYTINSAGYNVWYRRDEFRYLWKKMLDPLEGSVIILAGSGLVALGTWLGDKGRALSIYWAWLFGMITSGVIALFWLSAVGGIGGNSGHSLWWGLVLLPYPIGWLLGIANLVSRMIDSIRHRHAG